MNDDLKHGIEVAQSGPPADYMLYVELTSEERLTHIPLSTVRFPVSGMTLAGIADWLRGRARTEMAALGHESEDLNRAQLVLGTVPDDIIATLEEQVRIMQSGGSDLVLLDILGWVAAKRDVLQTPKLVGGGDEELTYKGLRIRQSAAG